MPQFGGVGMGMGRYFKEHAPTVLPVRASLKGHTSQEVVNHDGLATSKKSAQVLVEEDEDTSRHTSLT